MIWIGNLVKISYSDLYRKSGKKLQKMVSSSRLYFALLASVATMAFWMGMWSSTVTQNEKFLNPKPFGVILYYSGVENSSQSSSGKLHGKFQFQVLVIFIRTQYLYLL